MRSKTAGSCPHLLATVCTPIPASSSRVSWVPRRSWNRRRGKPSLRAWRQNSLVKLTGLRSLVKENPTPGDGGFGNINASAGSRTRERSTAAPSGTGQDTQMLLALRAQQRDQVIVYCDRALSAGGLWPLQSEPVLRSLLDRSLDAQRLCRNVKIVPPQRQDFVAPRARERGNRHD